MDFTFIQDVMRTNAHLLPADLYRVLSIVIGGSVMLIVCIRAFTRNQ